MKIGITERGDAGLDFSWVNKLQPANIIISKRLSNLLIKELITYKNKIIFHLTCTGYGGTRIEPNVPAVDETYNQFNKLLQEGFPVNQIVLRIDPIIPTTKGIQTVVRVLDLFRGRINRVRFSFLDIYPHVRARFIANGIKPPWEGFTAPISMMDETYSVLKSYELDYNFESCAENDFYKCGCISQKDLDVLGIDYKLTSGGYQRKGCHCAGEKYELLNSAIQCPHGCLYCYWKEPKMTIINDIQGAIFAPGGV